MIADMYHVCGTAGYRYVQLSHVHLSLWSEDAKDFQHKSVGNIVLNCIVACRSITVTSFAYASGFNDELHTTIIT